MFHTCNTLYFLSVIRSERLPIKCDIVELTGASKKLPGIGSRFDILEPNKHGYLTTETAIRPFEGEANDRERPTGKVDHTPRIKIAWLFLRRLERKEDHQRRVAGEDSRACHPAGLAARQDLTVRQQSHPSCRNGRHRADSISLSPEIHREAAAKKVREDRAVRRAPSKVSRGN